MNNHLYFRPISELPDEWPGGAKVCLIRDMAKIFEGVWVTEFCWERTKRIAAEDESDVEFAFIYSPQMEERQ